MKIEIKEEIIPMLKERVESSDEFENIDAYVNYILQQVAERLKNENGNDEKEDENAAHSEEDEEKVKERLKSLGYLE